MKITLGKKPTKNGFSLYLDISHRGQRKKEYLGLILKNGKEFKEYNKETKALANKLLSQRTFNISYNEHGFVSESQKKKKFIEYFEETAMGKKSANYHTTLGHLKKYFKENVYLSSITTKTVKEFTQYLANKGVSNNSINQYLTLIKVILNQAKQDKLILEVPAIARLKKTEVKKEYLIESEIKLLMESDKTSDTEMVRELKRAFLFCCFTGLRFSDAKKIKYSDIVENEIQIRQQKTSGLLTIPLNEIAASLISDRKTVNIDNTIFNLPSAQYTQDILKKWISETGIKKHITYHSSRHTFATLSLSLGIDLYTVSKFLGHSNIAMTQVYAKISDAHKKEQMNKFNQFKLKKNGLTVIQNEGI